MPAVSVPCPRCSTPVPVPEDAAGGRPLSCPRCSAVVRATPPAAGPASNPDFSHLRQQLDSNDDILYAEGASDGESVMDVPTIPAAKPPVPVNKPTPRPAAVVYTPPPVRTGDPFADLDDSGPRPAPSDRHRRKPEPTPRPDAPAPARLPKWVLPALLALAGYAVLATGLGVWGWVRPTTAAPPPAKLSR